MRKIGIQEVFFVNDDHKRNFCRCIEKFHYRNGEYTSTCYLAAYPEIFKCFSLKEQEDGPFDWFFENLEATSNSNIIQYSAKGRIAPLTGQTTALVHLALNLWNGHKFDLASGLSIWDSELYAVALQAINLRREVRNS